MAEFSSAANFEGVIESLFKAFLIAVATLEESLLSDSLLSYSSFISDCFRNGLNEKSPFLLNIKQKK